jgi:thioredoxin 1
VKRDLTCMLTAGVRRGIPVVIGTTGGGAAGHSRRHWHRRRQRGGAPPGLVPRSFFGVDGAEGEYTMAMNGSDAPIGNAKDLQEVLRTRDKAIVLFYADWCPFCVRFLPLFQKCAERGGRYFAAVRDDFDTLGNPYAVKVLPTVLFFENGVVSKRLDGTAGRGLSERQLDDFVESCPL